MSLHSLRRQAAGILPLVSSLLVALVITGCRSERPESPRAVDSGARPSTPTPSVAPRDSAPIDLSAPHAATPAPSGYWAAAAPHEPDPARTSARQEVLGTIGSFFTTIEAGNEADFRARLSSRSVELLRSMNAEGEVWPIAREALGTLENRRISFLGGVADSAALLVAGTRRSGDTSLPSEIVLSVLRESGTWKVMYPGAQPYQEHVGP